MCHAWSLGFIVSESATIAIIARIAIIGTAIAIIARIARMAIIGTTIAIPRVTIIGTTTGM